MAITAIATANAEDSWLKAVREDPFEARAASEF